MKISMRTFKGRVPKISAQLLPKEHGQKATNCKLWSGAIESWFIRNIIYNPDKTGELKSIYRSDANFWLHWNEDVDVVKGPIPGDTTERTYFTGTDAPRVTDETLITTGAGTGYPKDSYLLGIPVPVAAATAALGTGGSGTARSLAYYYTYVSGWGEQGSHSVPSNIVSALPGQQVNLSGMSTGPAGDYNITKKRIYRTNTGLEDSDYQLVAEIDVGQTTYTDTKLDSQLGEVIPSADFDMPPANMIGLIKLPNGVLAAFAGNEICFSEPFFPHAWPTKYRITIPGEIRAIAAFGSSVLVGTDSYPQLIQGIHPSAMGMIQLPQLWSCLSKRAMKSVGNGVVFPTYEGLAYVGDDARDIITRNVILHEDWMKDYLPASSHAVAFQGRYHYFTKTGLDGSKILGKGLVFEISSSDASLKDLSFYSEAEFVDPDSGELFVVEQEADNTRRIRKWEGDLSEKTEFVWRSKVFRHNFPANYAAARLSADYGGSVTAEQLAACAADTAAQLAANQALITAATEGGTFGFNEFGREEFAGSAIEPPPVCPAYAGVQFRYYVDGLQVLNKNVTDNEPFSLPPKKGRDHEVEITSITKVTEIALATSKRELIEAGQ